MGVGIFVMGRSQTPGWIDEVRGRMRALQHPSAEPIDVRDDGSVSATTTPVGPGYHVAVCDELRRAGGELRISWAAPEDEPRDPYFFDGDVEAIRREMLQWLQTVAKVLCESDPNGAAIAMPLDHEYRFDGIATPLGPRSAEWLRAVAKDPTNGIDFFSWWEPGENAAALLGRARYLMWNQVRWRMPTYDLEEELEDEVLDLLLRAWKLDPTLDYPAREWQEIGFNAPDQLRASEGPLIGYRRHPVRVRFRDWSVEIPGEFSEEWDDEGTFSAWHEGRTVWFNGYRKDAPASELVRVSPSEGELIERRDGPIWRRGYFSLGEDGHVLSTRNAVDGKLAIVTIVYPTERDRDWALRTWESLR